MTARAQQAYVEGLQRIPGVLRAAVYGGDTAAEQTVLVVLPSLRGPVADQVIDLEGEVRHAYPGSRLEIEIKSLAERRLREDEADSLVPPDARVFL